MSIVMCYIIDLLFTLPPVVSYDKIISLILIITIIKDDLIEKKSANNRQSTSATCHQIIMIFRKTII